MFGATRLLCLLALIHPACAAAQVSFSGARSAALAGATCAVPGDVRGAVNPASWAGIDGLNALLSVSQLYGLSELRYADAVLLVPARGNTLALGASTFGYELYRTGSVEVGIARRLAGGTFREISAGLRSRWEMVRIAQYGRTGALGLSAGLHLPVTPYITLGAAARNLVVRGPFRAEVPRSLVIGAGYRSSPSFTFTVDIGKEVRSPASVASGLEISLVPSFVLRAGAASAPFRVAGGAALRLRNLEADFAAIRHDVLGWSPSMSVLLAW